MNAYTRTCVSCETPIPDGVWLCTECHPTGADGVPLPVSDDSIGGGATNLVVFPMALVLLFAVGLVYRAVWGPGSIIEGILGAISVVFLAAVLVGVVLHELLHAVGYRYFALVPWEQIQFGVNWKAVIPYATCPRPVPASAYRRVAAVPGITLGVLPTVVGTATGSGTTVFFGVLMMVMAGGDGITLWLIRDVTANAKVIDHHDRCGCLVFDGQVKRDLEGGMA